MTALHAYLLTFPLILLALAWGAYWWAGRFVPSAAAAESTAAEPKPIDPVQPASSHSSQDPQTAFSSPDLGVGALSATLARGAAAAVLDLDSVQIARLQREILEMEPLSRGLAGESVREGPIEDRSTFDDFTVAAFKDIPDFVFDDPALAPLRLPYALGDPSARERFWELVPREVTNRLRAGDDPERVWRDFRRNTDRAFVARVVAIAGAALPTASSLLDMLSIDGKPKSR